MFTTVFFVFLSSEEIAFYQGQEREKKTMRENFLRLVSFLKIRHLNPYGIVNLFKKI